MSNASEVALLAVVWSGLVATLTVDRAAVLEAIPAFVLPQHRLALLSPLLSALAVLLAQRGIIRAVMVAIRHLALFALVRGALAASAGRI